MNSSPEPNTDTVVDDKTTIATDRETVHDLEENIRNIREISNGVGEDSAGSPLLNDTTGSKTVSATSAVPMIDENQENVGLTSNQISNHLQCTGSSTTESNSTNIFDAPSSCVPINTLCAQQERTSVNEQTIEANTVRRAHIRKSLKPRKLSFINVTSDSEADDEAKVPNGTFNLAVPETVLGIAEEPPPPLKRENVANTTRRRSLRPRRTIKQKDVFETEAELDVLLSDEASLQAYGPAQHWNADENMLKSWVPVERILNHRPIRPKKITKSIREAIASHPVYQRKMVEQEYFVKFQDRSYWHCAWVPGMVLLALHPIMFRNYIRQPKSTFGCSMFGSACDAVDIKLSPSNDENGNTAITTGMGLDKATVLGDNSLPEAPSSDNGVVVSESCCVPMIIVHSSEEVSEDDESKMDNCNDYEDVINWTSKSPTGAGSRRRYLLHWGVESYTLVPERVIDISEEFCHCVPTTEEVRDKQNVVYHSVLVKWLHLPASHCTWEIIEVDMDNLELVAKCSVLSKLRSVKPPDENEQKLLPILVRRHLIQLTEQYCTRIATMLCEGYGTSRTPLKQLSVVKNPDEHWKKFWNNEQPNYLSPISNCRLHPYQVEGVRWLWHAYHNRTNAILADEMGLGKTVQVISLLYLLWKEYNDYGPFIIVAPLSTLLNWEREFRIWAPDFHVIVYAGDKRSRSVMQDHELFVPNTHSLTAFHVLITSHELCCIERQALQTIHWSILIVDEAHRLKNKQSRLFKETSQYKADFKILLTGTPLQNTLEELFHLLNFIDAKKFADFKSLSESWLDQTAEDRTAHLHEQLKDHLLRRLKVDVCEDIPQKTEVIVFVDLTTLQRKLYKLVLTKNYEELRSGSLMNSLVHLQKVCDHPYLLPVGNSIAPKLNPNQSDQAYEPRALIQVSGKLTVLVDMLDGLRSRGHRVLLYSRLTTMLDILEEVVINAGYAYERLDGSVKGPARQVAIDRFNAPNSKIFLFLLSTRAGGEGINLASADTVILFDSDWNPQSDIQALSRAHRIGQSRHVVVYRFVTRNTMEERIYSVSRRKLVLTHLVVDQQQQRQERQQPETGAQLENSTTTESTNGGTCKEDFVHGSERSSCSDVIPMVPRNSRLNRAEMDDILRYGVEKLFAHDDPLDDSELSSAAHESSTDNAKRIVYDSEAIDRLLDRSNLPKNAEYNSAADVYLSAFRSAHFTQTDEPCKGGLHPIEIDLTDPCRPPSGDSSSQIKEVTGYATFWDRLLRERHMQLRAAEESTSHSTKRVIRWNRRYSSDQSVDQVDSKQKESILTLHNAADDSSSPERDAPDQGLDATDDDPLYIPSEDSEESSSSIVQTKQKCRTVSNRDRHSTTSTSTEVSEEKDSAMRPMELSPVVVGANSCAWPTGKSALDIIRCWKNRLRRHDRKITFENGHMFIYDFGPYDRQAFASAVMRFGLPPPNIVPPQDWLPPSLHHKSPDALFGYTSLFMRHLYDDPNGMDQSTKFWSDGLPKENLCVPAVLSRIAMMALIRNKVLEFEDINGVHSRTFEAVSTRFKFTIHEGGLTLLRPTWHEEWQRINRIVKPLATNDNHESFSSMTVKREQAVYHLQHTWHSRHDFWLLAGIHIHGYLHWEEILEDPRFHLLWTGVKHILEDAAYEDNGTLPDGASSSTQRNISKAHDFLLTRFRMLEQALVVEQALREVARAALSRGMNSSDPPVSRVHSLTVCLSNRLAATGPRKRITLPRDPTARETTRLAVIALQAVLEDFYADLPCLPAFVVCTETGTTTAATTTTSVVTTTTTTTGSRDAKPINDIHPAVTGVDRLEVTRPGETSMSESLANSCLSDSNRDGLIIEISDEDN